MKLTILFILITVSYETSPFRPLKIGIASIISDTNKDYHPQIKQIHSLISNIIISRNHIDTLEIKRRNPLCIYFINENNQDYDLLIQYKIIHRKSYNTSYITCGNLNTNFKPIYGVITINKNKYPNQLFQVKIFQMIINLLGFNKNSLKKINLSNNYLKINNNNVIYKSLNKYDSFYDKNIKSQNDDLYLDYWNIFPKSFDIMNEEKIYLNSSLSDLTIDLIEQTNFYSFSVCEIIYYDKKCPGFPFKKCVSMESKKNFLYYNYDDNGNFFCYVNDINDNLHEKCNHNYGKIITYDNEEKNLNFCKNHIIKNKKIIKNETVINKISNFFNNLFNILKKLF